MHLFLINEVRHSEKPSPRISTHFQHKYPFQNPKNKISFPLQKVKIQKEVGEQSDEKSSEKKGKKRWSMKNKVLKSYKKCLIKNKIAKN